MNKELELEKRQKNINNFKKFIKYKEDENDVLYESEEYYEDEIEQNELLLKMLHSILNCLENSIPKEKVEEKYKQAESEVIKIRDENIKHNNTTKYDYLIIGKRDAYKELLEEK